MHSRICCFGLFFLFFLETEFQTYEFQFSENKKKLIGVWEFSELTDNRGNKIDTIKHSFGWEIPGGPLITFHPNGNYTKQFTSQNIDKGKWDYVDVNKKIIYYLLLQENDTIDQLLISKGFAKKHADGKFYEQITDSVILLTDYKMVLYESPGRHRIFRNLLN